MKLFSKLLLAFAILFGLPHFVSAQTPNGAALYASNCQGCHGSLAASNVSNRTFAGIKAAIVGNLGGMGFLSSLADADLQAISNALSPPAPPAAPALSVSPSSLSFSYQQGGSAPAAQSLSVASGGSYTAAKSTSWLSISPTSGTTPGTVNVSVSAGMATGTYTDNVTITASGATGSPKSIPVTLTVTAAAAPTLSVSPSLLSFSYQQGGSAPAAQSLSVASGGSYTAAKSASWLSISPTSGTTSGTVNVSVSSGMAAGTYTDNVTITASGATGSPKSIPVTLTVTAAAAAPNGAALYASNCQGCHGSLATSNILNRTLAGIKAAIVGNVGGMGFLASLTDAELQAISNALSPPAPAPALSVAPSSLSFSYQQGGSAPASQTIMVSSSSGAQLAYTVAASGGAWLSATPMSGTTPGTVNVSMVNPASMAAGTYKGMVTITAPAGSPQTVAVTLVVGATTPAPGLNASPKTLSFAYQSGGGMPAAQPIMISSGGAQLAYTVTTSGSVWLSATPTSGTTPGTVNISVNPASMAAGTYTGNVTITPSSAAGSAQTVAVTLVVSAGGGTGNSSLKVSPHTLQFSYQTGNHMPSAKKLMITSTGAPLSYRASYSGGSSWLTVSPTGGTTPGTISVSVNPAGMPAGSHSGTIDVSAPGAKSISVAVTLMVTSPASDDDDKDEGGQGSGLRADAYVYDPMHSGAVAAQWVDGVGVPMHNAGNQGLLLSKNASGSAEAQAGAVIKNAQGLTLTELGFDVREGGQCSAGSPHFVVVTNDDVTHVVGGCVKGTTQTSLAIGWKRMRFDPSKPELASPPITPGQQVKSIAVILDQGPEAGANAGGGLVVLDNISINGKVVAKK